MTIREIINEKRNEIGKADLMPDRAAELLRELAALAGNVSNEIRQRDYDYNLILQKARKVHESAVDAKITAECSKEYLLKREASDTKAELKELISSLKYYLKNLQDEKWASRNL